MIARRSLNTNTPNFPERSVGVASYTTVFGIRRFRLRAVAAALLVGTGLAAPSLPAAAATATGTMAVSANILDNCTLSVAPVAFGNYVGSTANALTVNVSANCTLGGVATLSANAGAYVSTGYQRNMTNSANPGTVLPYNLYTNTGHTIIWGDGTSSTATIPVLGTGAAVNYPIYANLPTSSVVYPGAYADNVTVTLTY